MDGGWCVCWFLSSIQRSKGPKDPKLTPSLVDALRTIPPSHALLSGQGQLLDGRPLDSRPSDAAIRPERARPGLRPLSSFKGARPVDGAADIEFVDPASTKKMHAYDDLTATLSFIK
jgi:hypothetical protein